MKLLFDTFKTTGTLHHTYLVLGDQEINRRQLFDFLEKEVKVSIQGNPDFWHTTFDSMGVDNARALRTNQANKALGENKKIFIIETRAITVEAQNALLKIFEEPTDDTHIFLLMPAGTVLLPTLLSRVFTVSYAHDQASLQQTAHADLFLKASLSERLKKVGEIVEEKDKTKALALIDSLLEKYHKDFLLSQKPETTFIIQELLKCRGYINDRSPSLKLLLEHIALII